MKSASGSQPDNPAMGWFNQRTWRSIGGVSIAGCALMAWYGSEHLHEPGYSFVFWGIYWAVALLLLAIAIYMVLIDLRYLRLQFKLAERELFLDTLGSEDFRREIREAQARKNQGDGGATG